jgi:hypothetical protein
MPRRAQRLVRRPCEGSSGESHYPFLPQPQLGSPCIRSWQVTRNRFICRKAGNRVGGVTVAYGTVVIRVHVSPFCAESLRLVRVPTFAISISRLDAVQRVISLVALVRYLGCVSGDAAR